MHLISLDGVFSSDSGQAKNSRLIQLILSNRLRTHRLLIVFDPPSLGAR